MRRRSGPPDERHLGAGVKRERRTKRLVRRLSQEPAKPTESKAFETRIPALSQAPTQAVLTDYAPDAGGKGDGRATEDAKLAKGSTARDKEVEHG